MYTYMVVGFLFFSYCKHFNETQKGPLLLIRIWYICHNFDSSVINIDKDVYVSYRLLSC